MFTLCLFAYSRLTIVLPAWDAVNVLIIKGEKQNFGENLESDPLIPPRLTRVILFQNGEFQVYTPEYNNLHAANGYLYLKPVGREFIMKNITFVFLLCPCIEKIGGI
jgi:hypothetical protein